jgi:hypothetical protein
MEAVMNDTIVTVRFTDLAEARRALRMLKLLGSEGQLRVRAAALVERSARSGIGRPAGAADGDGVLPSRAEVVGRLVAKIEDPDPDVLDSALDALGGTATRQGAEEFSGELGAAGRR